ncbi:hypothetical protein QTP70_015759 [Hemibagrus guttatus]|uniref:Reverse transcriptase domain-containing protein n=1 Tax=Hemibagrus guttatus TaxID=175788 RepID=A0AAE0VA94_9TELE|nr:hypothetical protein QTP70_015759 [Hemibagrus guttatus]
MSLCKLKRIKIYDTSATKINFKVPHFDDPGFMKRLFGILPSLSSHSLIFTGDLNCVMVPVMDRSDSQVRALSSMSRSIAEFMSSNGCVDPWRFYNPQAKNVDAKILAKVLAFCLENILPKIISEEQTGFIRGRQLFF